MLPASWKELQMVLHLAARLVLRLELQMVLHSASHSGLQMVLRMVAHLASDLVMRMEPILRSYSAG